MGKSYRPYYPDEELLLPPSLREWMPEDHLAYFVGDVIGVFSSRRIERRLVEDIAFRVLAAENQPNFRTISDFRKIHLKTLEGLFEQVLKIALEAGVMKVGRVALDGTKIKANASKHRAMSYDRMKDKERDLRADVKEMMAQAEAADAEEDERYGDQRGDELLAELARRETRLKAIREAKRALEARARAKAAAEGGDLKQARPRDQDQYNFTDPESRLMKGSDGFLQAYNAQAAVEPVLQLIVGQTVTAASNDKEQLMPMVEVIEQQSGQRPDEILADSGYCSEKNLEALESAENPEQRIEGYMATERQKHGEYKEPCPRGALPANASRVDRMRRKLKTKPGRLVYAVRKTIVEPVFGQIKQARGFRQFLLRGIEKVRGEWSLVCLTHNFEVLPPLLPVKKAPETADLHPEEATLQLFRRFSATQAGPDPPDRPTRWIKIKNPTYTQSEGRHELFDSRMAKIRAKR